MISRESCWYCDENGNFCRLSDLHGSYALRARISPHPWVEVWVLGNEDGFGGRPVLGEYVLHHGPVGVFNEVTPKMMGLALPSKDP